MISKKIPLLFLAYALFAFIILYFIESSKDLGYTITILSKVVLLVGIPSLILLRDKKQGSFLSLNNIPKSSWKGAIMIGK